jgi:hypothetical protein
VKPSHTRGSSGGKSLFHPSRPGRTVLQGLVSVALGSLALFFVWGILENGTAASQAPAAMGATRAHAETLEWKIRELSVPGTGQPSSYKPIVITDDEANTYLRTQGPTFLPPAVGNPEIQIHPDHVSAIAEVDFDKLQQFGKQTNDIGAQVLGTLFKGRQKVSATGKLETGDGQGKLTIQDLSIGSTSIPDWLTQALLENYLEKTFKLDLSKPFPLPDHVTRIDLADGRATFVRSRNKKPPASHSPN